MKNYTYYWEIRDLIGSFVNVFNDVVIKRYNTAKLPEDQINVAFTYMPKNRVLFDIVNKAGQIKLPIISVSLGGIQRDVKRVFNKLEGPYYSLNSSASGFEHLLQPVPVNLTVNMSILTRFQQDLDQILSNFIPYTDPYVVVSWKMPITNLEIRSHIHWNGNVSITPPIDIGHEQHYRWIADTSFIIEGWLFKTPEDPVGKIYKIDMSFTAASGLYDNINWLHSLESIETTDSFVISARPQLKMIDPWLTIPCITSQHLLYGDMFDWVQDIYVSGGPGVYSQYLSSMAQSATATHWATYDPASGNPKISAMYPAFQGIPLQEYTIDSNNVITLTIPAPVSAGYVDVIAFNEAGYGQLTVDSVRESLNPYTSGTAEYDAYVQWQHPSVSGVRVGAYYYNCN